MAKVKTVKVSSSARRVGKNHVRVVTKVSNGHSTRTSTKTIRI